MLSRLAARSVRARAAPPRAVLSSLSSPSPTSLRSFASKRSPKKPSPSTPASNPNANKSRAKEASSPIKSGTPATPATAGATAAASRITTDTKETFKQTTTSAKQSSIDAAGDKDVEEAPRESVKAEEAASGSQSPDAAGTTKPLPDLRDGIPSSFDASEPPESNKPLPDLRYGIPSTFESEFTSKASKSSSAQPEHDPQNITEDADNAQSSSSSGTGGGRSGELPRSAYETSGDRMRARFANYAYLAFFAFGTVGAIYLGRDWETEEEENIFRDAPNGWGLGLMYDRARARITSQMGYYTEPSFPKLLPDMDPSMRQPYTLVLSLEDLLIHSEWTRENGWRTAKRPGVDYFLRYLQQYYELVIFTTLPSQAADQVIRKLDPYQIVMWPLFREATRYDKGEYIKDLSYLNRPLEKTILIDTNPTHAKHQPENAIILPKWTGQPGDKGLVALIPFLEYVATMGIDDVRRVIKSFEGQSIPEEFARRETIARQKHNEAVAADAAKRPRHSAPSKLLAALGLKPLPGQQGALVMEGESLGSELAKGKFVGDVVRERGQRVYELLDRQIREEGEKWLAEQKEMEKKMIDEAMKEQMKSGKQWFGGWFGGSGSSGSVESASS